MLDKILSDPFPNIALVAKYESWMDGTVVMLDNDNNILNFVVKKHSILIIKNFIIRQSISINSVKSFQELIMFHFGCIYKCIG